MSVAQVQQPWTFQFVVTKRAGKCRFDGYHGKSDTAVVNEAENAFRDNTSVYFVELRSICKFDEDAARSRELRNLLRNVLLHKNAVTIAAVVIPEIADRQITMKAIQRLSSEILVFNHQRDVRGVEPTFN